MYFGTDPEYLVVNRLGRPVPAHKVGFDDKSAKMLLSGSDEEFWESRAFRDGYMIEVNVAPDTCRQTVTYRMQRAIRVLYKKLMPKYRLVSTPAVRINLAKDLKNAPADVLQFGCEPSYGAYEDTAKVPLIDALSHTYRYAGGHLHFGHCPWLPELSWMKTKANHPQYIKLLDLYLGLPLTFLFDSKQTFQRRRFYGQAGEYRSQKYGERSFQVGVEYRTPGPEVWNEPWVASFAMGVGRYVGHNFKKLAKTWDKSVEDDLRAAINAGQGMQKLLKLAVLPGYNEYPTNFLQLKKYAPKQMRLTRAAAHTVDDGFYGWGKLHNVGVVNPYREDG